MRRADKEITSRAEKEDALRIIMKHYSGPFTAFDAASIDKILMIRVEIETLTGKKSG